MASMLWAAVTLSPDLPRCHGEVEVTHDLAKLTPGEAEHLAGRPARYRLTVASTSWYDEDFNSTSYECETADAVSKTVWLAGEVEAEGEQLAEGVLLILRHPTRTIRGQKFEGFTEYRLVDARLVR